LGAEAIRGLSRRKWDSGQLPDSFVSALPFLHAKWFVYELDGIGHALGLLVKTGGTPASLAQEYADWKSVFPVLQGIRDTAHHMEDRDRGPDRNRKPLKLQAQVDTEGNAVRAY